MISDAYQLARAHLLLAEARLKDKALTTLVQADCDTAVRIIEQVAAADEDSERTVNRARVLFNAGQIALIAQNMPTGLHWLDLAVSIIRALRENDERANGLIALCGVARQEPHNDAIDHLLRLVEEDSAMISRGAVAVALSEVAARSSSPLLTERALKIAGRALKRAELVTDDRERAVCILRVINAMRNGRPEDIGRVWRNAFMWCRSAGRPEVRTAISLSAPALVSIDGGSTIVRVDRAITEIDGWWDRSQGHAIQVAGSQL